MFYHKQIEVADKKLRATNQFLEDQAVEREIERDEAQKTIATLKEQLRKGEHTQDTCDRFTREVCYKKHVFDLYYVRLNRCWIEFTLVISS